MFRLYAKDEINQAGGECVFVRCKHSLRDKCERKKHERSLLTVFSDVGSTPTASTISFFDSPPHQPNTFTGTHNNQGSSGQLAWL